MNLYWKILSLMVVFLSAPAWVAAVEPGGETPQELQAKRDQLRMSVQKICPVTGNELGTHGEPVKAKVGKLTLHFCCEGCLDGQVDREHWATVHQNFIKGQRICPVMENELPSEPKWTIVEGQVFYVCCPPCIEKIEANPEASLAQLDKLHQASLKAAKPR